MRPASCISTVVASLILAGTALPAATADTPVAVTGQPCTIVGTTGSDTLVGTDGPDVICTLGGADEVFAADGDDVIDATRSESGRFEGGVGDDRIFAPAEPASGRGGYLIGGPGDDVLTGGAGQDQINGDAGNDVLRGGAGRDRLFGSQGSDVLRAGAGNDSLFGGPGTDVLDGGPGRDWISYHARSVGVSVSLDGVADDGKPGELDLVGATIENVVGGAGPDRITGTASANGLFGGSGDDVLGGAAGDDLLSGSVGDDILRGGAGRDRCDHLGTDRQWSCEIQIG